MKSCLNSYLHKYEIKKTFENGVIEICERCRDKQFFKNNVPNKTYYKYHIRNALQPSNKIFNREYKINA